MASRMCCFWASEKSFFFYFFIFTFTFLSVERFFKCQSFGLCSSCCFYCFFQRINDKLHFSFLKRIFFLDFFFEFDFHFKAVQSVEICFLAVLPLYCCCLLQQFAVCHNQNLMHWKTFSQQLVSRQTRREILVFFSNIFFFSF